MLKFAASHKGLRISHEAALSLSLLPSRLFNLAGLWHFCALTVEPRPTVAGARADTRPLTARTVTATPHLRCVRVGANVGMVVVESE